MKQILISELSLFVNLTLSNASLVGAKTVKGPAEARVSTKPAALTAARRVENLKIRDGKTCRYCRYICAIFWGLC